MNRKFFVIMLAVVLVALGTSGCATMMFPSNTVGVVNAIPETVIRLTVNGSPQMYGQPIPVLKTGDQYTMDLCAPVNGGAEYVLVARIYDLDGNFIDVQQRTFSAYSHGSIIYQGGSNGSRQSEVWIVGNGW
jgi:hypothetical protein